MSARAVRERAYEALWGAAFLLVIAKISHAVADVSYLQVGDIRQLRWWIAMLLNTIGVFGSIHTAGLLFGIVGFAFEYWGASIVFANPELGLLRISVGAVIIITGRPIWQGMKEVWKQ